MGGIFFCLTYSLSTPRLGPTCFAKCYFLPRNFSISGDIPFLLLYFFVPSLRLLLHTLELLLQVGLDLHFGQAESWLCFSKSLSSVLSSEFRSGLFSPQRSLSWSSSLSLHLAPLLSCLTACFQVDYLLEFPVHLLICSGKNFIQ